MIILLIGIVVSYIVGSIPTAYIFGKLLKGIDIREHGSGNVGATNVFRVLGKWPGIVVLLLDIYKGFWAVGIVSEILGMTSVWQRVLMSVAVVAGHNYTVFLDFKGGKGVATSLGALLGLALRIPTIGPVLLITLGVFLLVFLSSRIVSLSSICAAGALPLMTFILPQPVEIRALGLLIGGFVIFRHRANIQRLLAGSEPRVPLFGASRKNPKK
ncbi:MAG: glycerol-3-phosphate 1-O-acyltransferase PlsY [Candidatus Omnitrophica bacterium]|nr:glycerol-3-phosphate 1-O-acyltransferase PlsY [Candidatus Omnitrophota bacterium]MCB9721185.1 glycerol-3-phosphate 1-O-acyltransferase PlsY [Candidatus Omnitrophota bacterium]